MTRPTTWFLLVFCLAGLLLARESRQPGGSLAGVDRAFFDWLVTNTRLGSARDGELPVTLVEIDDSVADVPGRLPLSPLEYGAFLRSAGRYEPAVVAVEPILDFPRVTSGTEQILLEQAIGIPKLLLGVRLGDSAGNGRDASSLPVLANPVAGSTAALANFPEIVSAPNARLLTLVAASGATNLPGAGQGPVRDVPLLFRCRDRVLPAFALQMLILSQRLAPSEVSAAPGGETRLGERLRLPVDRAGHVLLDARAMSLVQRLNLDDLPLIEAGQAPAPLQALARRMRGGVVILGRTDHAARTLRMPDGQPISPAEVFAWAAVSLQRVPAVRRASTGWDAGVALAFLLVGLAARRGQRGSGSVLPLLALAFYVMAALSTFEWARLWLPVALPAGLALLTSALAWVFTDPPKADAAKSPPALRLSVRAT